MLNLRYITIKQKLVLMQVFTSIVVLFICFVFFVITHVNEYKDRKVESMHSLAGAISSNVLSALQFEDREAARNILMDLRKVAPAVTNAAILTETNQFFAGYTRAGSDTFKFDHHNITEAPEFTEDFLFIYHLISDSTEVVGTVCMRSELKELKTLKVKQFEMAFLILLCGIGLSFLIAIWATPYISNRLLHLVTTMQEIRLTADYTKQVNSEGTDEISALSFEFNNLMDKVKENLQKKDEFISIASHELKTPLTTIKSYVQIMESIQPDPAQNAMIRKTLESVNRLQQLIYDLLDVSKIQSGQLQLDETIFNLEDPIRETIAGYQVISREHQIIFKSDKENVEICADRRRIEQVMINLLSNAVKYSPNGKEVHVEMETDVRSVKVTVRDFGIGIPRDEHPYVFDRFYRTKGNSTLVPGFGLGLYICKDIITRHQGKIRLLDCNPGTAVSFTLPLDGRDSTNDST